MATELREAPTFRGGEYVATLMAELSRAAIAQRIARARKQAGLDQHELADLLGVHWRTVQDWESPKKHATPWDRIDEIAAVTEVSKEWLLHGEREAEATEREMILRRLEEVERVVVASRESAAEGLEALARGIARIEEQLSIASDRAAR